MTSESRDDTIRYLKDASSVILSTHISPDSDAIGSVSGMARGLASLGKHVTIYTADSVPRRIRSLLGDTKIVHELPNQHFDLVVALDCATKKRLGMASDQLLSLAPRTVNIDHHVSNEKYCQVNYISSKAAATAEMVVDLLGELGGKIDQTAANLLLAGLMDDTGSFRYSNTDPEAHETAAALLRAGASIETVSNELYYTTPVKVLKLRAQAILAAQVFAEGKIAFVVITQDFLSRVGAQPEESDGIVDDLRSIEGSVVACMLRELEQGVWKASIRAKDSRFDANRVAAGFGGGGHPAAAGCTITGKQREVESRLLDALASELKR